MSKRSGARGKKRFISDEIESGMARQHRARVKRHHVAQEYQDNMDMTSATGLCRGLRPWAARAVLG